MLIENFKSLEERKNKLKFLIPEKYISITVRGVTLPDCPKGLKVYGSFDENGPNGFKFQYSDGSGNDGIKCYQYRGKQVVDGNELTGFWYDYNLYSELAPKEKSITKKEILPNLLVEEFINGVWWLKLKKQNNEFEKMSKSKENVVSVEEMTKMVVRLDPPQYFVTLDSFLKHRSTLEYTYVDPQEVPVCRNQNGYYYTPKIYGHIPILLIDDYEYVPRFSDIEFCCGVQHADRQEVIDILED